MERNRFIVYLCVLILFLVFPLCSVQGTVVPFQMGVIFNGTGVPTNPSPWVNAAFTDVSSGQVKLTIAAAGLTANEKVGEVYFNLDPALNPAQLAFSALTKTGSFEDPIISKGVNGYKADGDGYYDILIAFDTDGQQKAFNGGDTLEYMITLPSLTANSFDFASTPDGTTGEYKSVVHLLGLGTSGLSAWATTPEPATIGLLGLGALALRRRK